MRRRCAMAATVTSIRRDAGEVTNYDLLVGYAHSVQPDGTIADTLRQMARLWLQLAPVSGGEGDRVETATVWFRDLGAGPVTSLGKVIQQTGALTVEVSLPQDQFVAFWHAMRHPHHIVDIAWKENDEVIAFSVSGSPSSSGEDQRERLESLRRELSGETGSQ
jgi:hypothetical protein